MYEDGSLDQFASKWLSELIPDGLNKPVLGIINGWMSEYWKNQWYADALKDDLYVFAYDSRGQGKSPKMGELNAYQGSIDANHQLTKAFDEFDRLAAMNGDTPGKFIVQGNCVGTMVLASLFAGKLPVSKRISGTILISPVSSFSLPFPLNLTPFIPVWFVNFAVKYLAPTIVKLTVPGKDSEFSRREALKRTRKLIPNVAIKQAKQIFWKENVSTYWEFIDVPSLILVSNADPMVKLHHSFEAYNKLPYPIWIELKAADHLVLEENIDYLKKLLPKFAKDPWGFYEENKHLSPYN